MPGIREYAARHRVRPEPSLPRFSGGLVGYFGYDCVRYFEPKLAKTVKHDPLGVAAEHLRADRVEGAEPRSEEHTSELQSLMRISYAVFCLKKKNKQTKQRHKK